MLFVIVVGFFSIEAANFVPFIPEARPTEGGGDVWAQSLFSWMTGAAPAQYGVFGLLAGSRPRVLRLHRVRRRRDERGGGQGSAAHAAAAASSLGLGVVTVLYVLVTSS